MAPDGTLHTVHVDVRYEHGPEGRLGAIHEDIVRHAGDAAEILHTTTWTAEGERAFSHRRAPGEDHLALAVEGGAAHVVFGVAMPGGGTELRYAGPASGELVLAAGATAALSHASIAIGPGGMPHVAFSEDGALRVAVGREDGFEVEDVAGRSGERPRVAVAADGTIFVAFLDDGGVELARRPPGRCE
jgi:hypothetical protein